MTKHLAFTLSGAVALGAFEAGVLAQIYADVEAINSGPEKQIAIDALSGASAGAISATLLAQALTVGMSAEEFTNQMLQLWTATLNVYDSKGNLFAHTDAKNNPNHSLFDNAYLSEVADQVLMKDADIESAAKEKNTPPVAFSIGLSNTSGIPYALEFGGETLFGKIFSDYEPVFVHQGAAYRTPPIEEIKPFDLEEFTPIKWSDEVKIATISSGCVPAAFRTQLLNRPLAKNYPDYKTLKELGGTANPFPDTAHFSYTDGGMLNNEPLGKAIDASSWIDAYYGPADLDWTFVTISPAPLGVSNLLTQLNVSDPVVSKSKDEIDHGVKILDLPGRLYTAYFGDDVYRDVLTASKVNKRLADVKSACAEVGLNEKQAEKVLAAAGLDFKKPIAIALIQPKETLKGAFLGDFGGFMYQPYQESDFYNGCVAGREWIETWATGLENVNLPKELQYEDPQVTKSGFADIPADQRSAIEDRIVSRIEALFQTEFGAAGLERGALELFRGTIKHLLNEALVKST